MSKQVLLKLKPYKKIVFGPFIGEFGWEVSRWCGFVRWYCKKHPEKIIVVYTRESSKDFYLNLGNNVRIETMVLKNDYTKFLKPMCYKLNGSLADKVKTRHMRQAKSKYPGFFIFTPMNKRCKRNLFHPKYYDFKFKNDEKVINIIKDFKKEHKGKKLIAIAARHRTDINYRNWVEDHWDKLFDMIEEDPKLCALVLGQTSSMFISKKKRDSIKYLTEFNNGLDPSVGLTIEAIKNADITIGPQTGSIILSNAIGVQTLFWGHEIKRHAIDENYSGVTSVGILDKKKRQYVTKPEKVFEEIQKMI